MRADSLSTVSVLPWCGEERGEHRRITVNTLLIILWSSIMKTETMEINMSLAVVNMFVSTTVQY